EHGVTRVRLQHRRAQLERARRLTGDRHRHERISEHGTREPQAREPIRFCVDVLLHDAVDGRAATGESDAHVRRYLSGGSGGRPRMRSPIWLRLISDVPPAMDMARCMRTSVLLIIASPSMNAVSGPLSSASTAAA